jgi:hypothetical protein
MIQLIYLELISGMQSNGRGYIHHLCHPSELCEVQTEY